ncbi:Autoinducer 2 kinase LsrK [Raoultella terrigena]|uniref:Autoinducer 2 kinase LsrK n=1 Tax=Raoultella terrigena TaxID=577 RepID=A0A4U9D7U5_RAOTE|nr:Autoinducer 2 kinase LsrK [Raoultella terrigena]
MGGGDVQLGCLGLGVVRAGQTAVLGGTFWQQVVNLPQPRTDPEMNIRVNPHVIPGMAQAESISFFTGLTMRWFRDAFCAEEKLVAERLGVDAYSLLEEMASRVPAGSHGVMPIFSDAMHFKQWYHAAPSFINLSIDPEKCNKATLFRALEENAAIVSACNLAQISRFSGSLSIAWSSPAAGRRARCGARSSATSPACRCASRWCARPPPSAAPSPPEPVPGCTPIWRRRVKSWWAGIGSLPPTRRIASSIRR